MVWRRRAVVTAVFLVIGMPSAHSLDFSQVTCHDFLASGRANMAALIMFLRGYHAGRTAVIPYNSGDHYGGKLGFYCRQHPRANLIQASEQILNELDRGL